MTEAGREGLGAHLSGGLGGAGFGPPRLHAAHGIVAQAEA